MTDREKLIELMRSFQNEHNSVVPDKEGIADHLIANGVTVNQCKVGDTVYALYSRYEYKKRSGAMYRQNAQILTIGHLRFAMDRNAVEIREKKCTKTDLSLLGRTVFASREDAEVAIMPEPPKGE